MQDLTVARALLALSDEDCSDILRAARYGDTLRPAACDRCGTSRFRRVPGRPRIDRCRGCRHDHSVTASTALHGLRVPLGRILATLWLLTRPGSISTRKLAILFDVHWKDAAPIAHKLRKALAAESLPGDAPALERQHIRLRREPGTRPKNKREARFNRKSVTALAIVHPSGRYVADIAQKDLPTTIHNLTEDHAAGRHPPWQVDAPRPHLAYARAVLDATHQTVCRRWVRVYVRALGWRSDPDAEATPAFQALGVVLSAPRRTWRQVVPPRFQEHAAPVRAGPSRFR